MTTMVVVAVAVVAAPGPVVLDFDDLALGRNHVSAIVLRRYLSVS